MKVEIDVKSVEEKRYRKGPSEGQAYTTVAGMDTGNIPWLKQVIEVRCDPARTDIKVGDKVSVGVTGISVYNGVAQLDGKLDKVKN
jgi:hypothetical protein